MAGLEFSLVIGAALDRSVGHVVTSLNKQILTTANNSNEIKIGKVFSESAQNANRELEEITENAERLDRVTDSIDLDSFNGEVEKSRQGVTKLTEAWENFKVKADRFKADIRLAGSFVSQVSDLTSSAVSFQDSMAMVSTLVDTSSVNMQDLSDKVLDISKSYGISTDIVANGMYQALSAGVEVEKLGGFMETAAKAAKAGKVDFAIAVDGITTAINSYKNMGLSAADATDILFNTVNRGKTRFDALAVSLANVTPVANSLGVSFQDVSAAIASLTLGGTQTSVATTQIRTALSELSDESNKAAQFFRQATGKSFKAYIASGHSLGDAFEAIGKKAKRSRKDLNNFFGQTSAPAVLALTGASAARFGEDLNIMASSAGTTQTAFEKIRGTSKQTNDELRANIEVTKIKIGEGLLPIVDKATGSVLKLVQVINRFVQDFPVLSKVVIIATGAFFGLRLSISFGSLIYSTGMLIKTLAASLNISAAASKIAAGAQWLWNHALAAGSGIIGTVTGFLSSLKVAQLAGAAATKIVTAAQWLWNAALTANPIGMVIVAIGIFAGLAYIVYKNWEPIVQWFKESFSVIGDFIGSIFGKADKIKAEVKKEESKTVKVEKEAEKPRTDNAPKEYAVEQPEKVKIEPFSSAPSASNKTVNITISNFTINSQTIEEALPRIKDKIVDIVRNAVNEEMENSYAG